MSDDNSGRNRNTPLANMANRLYSRAQGNQRNGARHNQDSETRLQTDLASANTQDRFASLFETLEKHPDNGYNIDFDKRHPELKNVTPELRPFLREVLMRQELKGWMPKIQQTKRSEEEELKHIQDGTSWLKNPKSTKHLDLGNGADAADVTDHRYGWGKGKKETGPEADFKDQRAKAYFKDQQRSFDETKQRWGASANRFNWGGYWRTPDLAHIENSRRVVPSDDANDEDQ